MLWQDETPIWIAPIPVFRSGKYPLLDGHGRYIAEFTQSYK